MLRKCRNCLAVLAALLILVSCGNSSQTTASDSERMKALGEEFVAQVDELIPLRESISDLQAQNAVVSTPTQTYNIDAFYQFYENYKVGSNAELLTIFSTKSFVVSKIVFEGESGYYFRYEFDPLNPESIVVTPQLLDKVQVLEDTQLDKIELTLQKAKKTDIVFTYKNIDR